ncbi:MAG TPA: hypothetical protein VGL18_07440 [Actinomycetota bacterium]
MGLGRGDGRCVGLGLGEADLVGFGAGPGSVVLERDGLDSEDGIAFVARGEGNVRDIAVSQAVPSTAIARRTPKRLARMPTEVFMGPMLGATGNRAFTLG